MRVISDFSVLKLFIAFQYALFDFLLLFVSDIQSEENKKLVGGSSGGPYMQNLGPDAEESWAVSGLVSASVDRAGCDQPVTIYTAVHPFKEWIENVVEGGQ